MELRKFLLRAGAVALTASLPFATPAVAETSISVLRTIDTDRYDPG